jgi:hypothetical protein
MDNNLTEFNAGGSHEQSPTQGIPQGKAANGQLNTVEEGETKVKVDGRDYIFSAKLSTKIKYTDKFNLPKYVEGKTFAEASKAIEKTFKDRTDNASNSTKQEFMSRLSRAQELAKVEKEARAAGMGVEEFIADKAFKEAEAQAQAATDSAQQAQSEIGQTEAPAQQEEQPLQPSLEPSGEAQFKDGGYINKYELGGNDWRWPWENAEARTGKEGKIGKEGREGRQGREGRTGETGVVGQVGEVGEAPLIIDPMTPGTGSIWGNAKGPVPGSNDSIPDILQPNAPIEETRLPSSYMNDQFSNFDRSGETGFNGSDYQVTGETFRTARPIAESIPGTYATNSSSDDDIRTDLTPIGTPFNGEPSGEGEEDSGNKFNYTGVSGLAASMAPFIGNMIESGRVSKPDPNVIHTAGRTYIPQFADERTLVNSVDDAYGGLDDSIANASNGNLGSYRANLIGARAKQGQARSQAYSQINEINRGERKNLNADFAGAQREGVAARNLENDLDKQDKAAYDDAKSTYRTAAYEGLGELGKSIFQMNQIEDLTSYNLFGDKKKTKG